MIDCVIFDLDGVIANVTHRLHYIKGHKKDYASFEAASLWDEPYPYAVKLTQLLQPQIPVFICTARPESMREGTKWWLSNYAVLYEELIMRAVDDKRQDHTVKLGMLKGLRARGYNPIVALEDRPSCVNMWRGAGVPCLSADDTEWKT